MPTQEQLNNAIQRARQAGIPEDIIQRKVSQFTVTPNAPSEPKRNLSQKVGGFLKSAIVDPVTQAGNYIGESGYQLGRFASDPIFRKAILGKDLSNEEHRYLAHSPQGMREELTPAGIGFGMQEESFKDKSTMAKDLAKNAANLASLVVPVGKTAGQMVKFGAMSGGLQGLAGSNIDSLDQTIGDVALGSIGGGAGNLIAGKAIHSISKMGGKSSSKLKKSSKALSELSSDIRQGTRQVKQPASVYGYSTEKAINKTLDKYGFKGTASNQYANLEPTMQKIGTEIKNFVDSNPGISVSSNDIKSSFMTKLKSSIRTKDLSSKQAEKEVQGYLNDVMKEVGSDGDSISLEGLVNLKKLINKDYGSIAKKIQNGTTLQPREKIIEVAWGSIDDSLKGVSPKIKELFRDQSNLYKAAGSLSRARFNPPTLRAVGISIPQPVTEGGRRLAGAGLDVASKGINKLSNVVPEVNINPSNAVNDVAQVGGRLVGSEISAPQDQLPVNNNEPIGVNTPIPNSMLTPAPAEPKPAITQDQLLQLALMDAARGGKNLGMIKQLQAMVGTASQSTKPLSASQQQAASNAQNGLNMMGEIESLLDKDPTVARGAVLPNIVQGEDAQRFSVAKNEAMDVLRRLRTGAAISSQEESFYASMFPQIGDKPETKAFKIKLYKDLFERLANPVGAAPTYQDVLSQPISSEIISN